MLSMESAVSEALSITEEIRVQAPIDLTFAAVIGNWGRSTRCGK